MVDSVSIASEVRARRTARPTTTSETAYLVFDTESIPAGELLARVKYPDDKLSGEEAIDRAQREAREASRDGSDFLPVTFQIPVAVCVMRVASDFRLLNLTALGAPDYQRRVIVEKFWQGVELYRNAKLVTFNGRGFDLPLMELAAYDHDCAAPNYFRGRNRYHGNQIDLYDWFTNFGAVRLTGGLNLLAKRRRLPGKLGVEGDQVYAMYRAGKIAEINDYCLCDTLDTYLVFLQSRVMTGELTVERRRHLEADAREWVTAKSKELPALSKYLEAWEASPIRLARTEPDLGSESV